MTKEDAVPKVGKKEFPYTEKGEEAAKKEAKKTGKSVKRDKPRHGEYV